MNTGIAAKAFASLLRDQPVTDMHREDCRGCGESMEIIHMIEEKAAQVGKDQATGRWIFVESVSAVNE